MRENSVVILDFGAQYTKLIARSVREQHVYCEIVPFSVTAESLRKMNPGAIILSGGPSSIYENDAPRCDEAIFDLGIPVLGICYGLQLIGRSRGAAVRRARKREYGKAMLQVEDFESLFSGFEDDASTQVWMSHGDSLESLPAGFKVLAATVNCPFAAIGNAEDSIYGVQFHPEVVHSVRGSRLIANFLFRIAGCAPDWTAGSFIEQATASITAQAGDSRVICGLSGGVDSSVAAMLVHRAIGDKLTCIFVDNGLLRKNERASVESTFRHHYHIDLVCVDAGELFLTALAGVTD
ncbi:MAG: glutamine-hydrolyzing GMP synthase, partial [Gemmatimonadota bacterium]|nr:glutamine-hydrolyzing GMP synthase [Gemmatimonadota bacterium]